ncbi:MAG: efflux RND transporter periplasmic adaptor subunit [Bacteroidales bacterium]
MKRILLLLGAVAFIQACHTGHSHEAAESEHETEPVSITLFTDNVELFAEYSPFITGHESAFAAHLNDLVNFKPFPTGSLTVTLQNSENRYENRVDGPSVPGIYRPVLTPDKPGIYRLSFHFDNGELRDSIVIDSVRVYQDHDEVPAPHDHGGEEIVYLKEQAWKTDFATEEVAEKAFYTVIKTSARVKSLPAGEAIASSQAAGRISLYRVAGDRVRRGDAIASVSGGNIEKDLAARLNELQVTWEKSKADYDRTKPLAESQIISMKEFLEIQARYKQDSASYFRYAGSIQGNSSRIVAPADGIISDIMVVNGGYVEAGAPVAKVISSDALMVEAYVNQSDYRLAAGIFDANFKTPSDDRIITLTSLNGKVRSAGAFLSESSLRIPVNFEVTGSGELIPGMFLEAYLKTAPKEKALTVPFSAISEEQGRHYVYIQKTGEAFEKREVILAGNDGLKAEVILGIAAGERVVTKGVQPIRLSSMAGGLPLHGHTH